jgi:hypothetical protein
MYKINHCAHTLLHNYSQGVRTRCRELSRSGVSVKKTTENKYLILILLAGDIKGIYGDYFRVHPGTQRRQKAGPL